MKNKFCPIIEDIKKFFFDQIDSSGRFKEDFLFPYVYRLHS